MNPRFCTTVFAFLCFLCAVGSGTQPAPGQEKPDKDAKKKDSADAPKGELKDPTNPSPKLKELLQPEKAGKGSAGPGPKMPLVALRGRVISKEHSAVALLEVDGRFYSITKGSSLPGGNNTMLRILDITSAEVRIEVLPLKEIIILR
jgi:hypothetical protein